MSVGGGWARNRVVALGRACPPRAATVRARVFSQVVHCGPGRGAGDPSQRKGRGYPPLRAPPEAAVIFVSALRGLLGPAWGGGKAAGIRPRGLSDGRGLPSPSKRLGKGRRKPLVSSLGLAWQPPSLLTRSRGKQLLLQGAPECAHQAGALSPAAAAARPIR